MSFFCWVIMMTMRWILTVKVKEEMVEWQQQQQKVVVTEWLRCCVHWQMLLRRRRRGKDVRLKLRVMTVICCKIGNKGEIKRKKINLKSRKNNENEKEKMKMKKFFIFFLFWGYSAFAVVSIMGDGMMARWFCFFYLHFGLSQHKEEREYDRMTSWTERKDLVKLNFIFFIKI